MSDLASLRAEIERIKDVEAIKRLKYRYIRSMTLSLWDELESLLTEDVSTSYSDGKYSFEGRDALMQFLRAAHDVEESPAVAAWQVTMPEITLTSDSTANGIWGMSHYFINKEAQTALLMFVYYDDAYVKIDGEWKFKKTGYKRVIEEEWQRKDLPSLTLNVG